MKLTEQEFDEQFRETLDFMVETMANNPEIDVEKFYGLACFVENLSFFSPVLYGLFQPPKNQ